MEPTDSQHEPLAYLTERFRNDADTLRQRAAAPAVAGPSRGPDAAASNRMANACDAVIARLRRADASRGAASGASDKAVGSVLSGEPDETMLRHLTGVAEALAREAAGERDPWVRSVYGGAATRIADVVARTRAAWQDSAEVDTDHEMPDDLDDDPGDDLADDLDDDPDDYREHESEEEFLGEDAEEDA